jgi:hypothetical protein
MLMTNDNEQRFILLDQNMAIEKLKKCLDKNRFHFASIKIRNAHEFVRRINEFRNDILIISELFSKLLMCNLKRYVTPFLKSLTDSLI